MAYAHWSGAGVRGSTACVCMPLRFVTLSQALIVLGEQQILLVANEPSIKARASSPQRWECRHTGRSAGGGGTQPCGSNRTVT